MKQHWPVAATAALVSAVSSAQLQPRSVDITPCVGIASAVARLDCYDRLARDASANAADQAARAPGESAPEPLRHANETAPTPDVAATTKAVGEEITSRVAALREIQPGRLEIELANSQVWRQTGSDRYRLQVGHEVRIYRTRFRSQYFRLTAPAIRGFVQVERIR